MLRQGYTMATAVLLLTMLPFDRTASAQDIHFFSIATGGVSGTYYPVGGLISDVISQPPGARACERGGSCGVPNMVAIASSSDGSIANVRAIAQGQVDSGFAQSDVAHDAFKAEGAFKNAEPMAGLRLIASLYLEHAHIVAKNVFSIEELVGKRVSVDRDGSGTQRVAKLIIDAHGIEEGQVIEKTLQPGQSIGMMRSGELDAFIVVAGYPTASVVEATESLDTQLLPMSQEAIDTLVEKHPFFSSALIPPSSYPNQNHVVPTIGVVAQWLTSAEADEDLIYAITKSLWHPTSRILLDNGHHRGSSVTLDTALDGAAVPLHPGAERFYREQQMILD